LRKKKATPEEVALTLGLYVKRWQRSTSAGLESSLDHKLGDTNNSAGLGSIPAPWYASESPYAGRS